MFKFLTRLLLIAALVVPWATQAQTLESYGFTTGIDASKWVDMTSATQILSPSASDGLASSVESIGFEFPFGASTYTQYSVNTDGNLRLGSTVTGVSNYSTPFSSTNANINNPKINAFGCDGYGVSGSHYVKALAQELTGGDSLLVVEFCMGTYNNTTRNELYKWQIHLYSDGNIEIVFPDATGIPTAGPNVVHQCGICASSSDGWVISSSTNTAQHFTAGSSVTNATGTWFDANRYYSFIHPSNISCPAPTGITVNNITNDGATFSWTAGGTETSWEVIIDDDSYIATTTSYTVTGLDANTTYVVSVRAICGTGDTSFASSALFRTACNAISQLPYSNDFENEPYYLSGTTSYAEAFPYCWHRINDATGTYNYYPYINSSTTYLIHGSKSMYWYHATSDTYADNQYAILPAIDLDAYSIDDLTLTFWAKTTATAAPWPLFIVGVMTDPTDATTFVPVDTITLTNNATMYIVSLANYSGTGNYIAIRSPRTTSARYFSLDDIYLTDAWCDMPGAAVASSTLDEVTISWESNGGSSFTVYLGADTITGVTDTFYTFQNLASSTEYSYGIATECSNSISMFVTGTVRTQCGYIETLPYTENFDGITGSTATSGMANILPVCWDYFNNGTRANYQGCPYVYSSSTYSHSGSNCVRFYSYNSSGDSNQYLILPAVDPTAYQITDLMVSFWLRGYSTSSTYHNDVVVGVMTNPADASTFVPVTTITSQTTTYGFHEVDLSLYNGPEGRVAFLFPKPTSSSSYEYGYIDDITLGPLPECPNIQNLAVDSLSVDWAAISWGASDNATTWIVEYDTVDFVPGSGNALSTEIVNEANYTMTDLDTGYTYFVYVRANCGNDTSAFASFSVTTLASVPASVPYTCDFEGNLTNGWDFIQDGQTNYWMVGNATSSTGSKSMYITDNGTANNYSGTESYSFAIRTFNLTEVGEYAFSYDWKCYGEGSYDFLRVAMVPVSTTLTAGNYCGFNNGEAPSGTLPTGGIPLDGKGRLNLNSNWLTRTGTFTVTAPGAYNLVFFWRNDGSVYNQPPAAIDNISLSLNTCPTPINLQATHITSDSIVVSWQAVGEESSWLLTNGVDTLVVSDTIYVFENLPSSTNYTITVRALCDAGDTSMAITITAATSCVYATLPIIEDFENYTGSTATSPVPEGFLPTCWDIYNHGTRTNYQYAPYIYNSGTYSHSGNNCIRFYSYNSSGDSNQYLILPPVDPDEYQVSDLQLSFWLRGNTASSNYFANVIVGVMTNPTVESSFIPYDTINYASTIYAYQEVNFNHYTGPHGRVTLLFPKPLSSSQYEYGYVDDLTLGPIPTCLMVEDLVAVHSAADSIIIAWTPSGDESAWEVSYGGTSVIVNDTFFAADQLSSNTEYTFVVRAICSPGDTSYAASVSARTDCGDITILPYIESFEGLPAGTSSNLDCGVPCWGRLDNASSYHFGYIGSPSSWPSGGHTGTGFLYYYMPTTTGTYADWIITILPPIDTNTYPLNTLQLSFWVKMNSTTTTGDIQVGVISNTNDESTFIPLDTVHVAGNVYDLKTAYLSNYVDTANATHLALKFFRDPSTTTYYFVDDVTVEPIPDCPPVSNINLTRMTVDSLYVTWTENGNASSWNVEYGPTGFTPGSGTTEVVSSLPMEIGNLTANTAYDVYVTPVCNDGVSATRMGTFRTDCGATPVPFTETFDTWSSTAADPLPSCWEKHTNYSTNYPYASTSYYHGASGKSMYMYSTSSTYSYMVLPAFDLPIDSTQISFWLYKSNTSYTHRLQVGVMTNPADVSTFVQVAEVVPTLTSTWEQFDVSFSNYTGTGTRIAIMSPDNEYSYPYLDDLSVSAISGCQRVSDLTATDVMLDSAIVTWVDGNNTSWYVEYDNVDFTPGSTPSHNLITVTDTFCVLSGLDSGTTYHVYVYPDCDTIVTRHITFTTLAAAPATVPFSCNFEAAGVNGWDLIQAGQGNYWVVGNATANGGTQSLYITDNGTANNYSGNASYSFAVRTFHLQPGNYICSFDWKAQGEGSYDFIRAALVPAATNIAAGEYSGFDNASAIPAGSIALDGGYRLNLQGTTWQTEVTEFSLSDAGNYKLVILWRNDGSIYNQPPAAIDNVQLMINSCPMPENITITSLSQTTVDLSWNAVGTATTYEYQLDNSTPVVTYDTFCTFTGLSDNTVYTFRVRSICSMGDTGMWASYSFRTPCGAQSLPYTEDLENESTSSSTTGSAFVNCWTRLNNGTSYGGYPYVSSSSTYNHTPGGSKGFYWYNSTTTGTYGDYQCVVLPPVDQTVGVDSLQISFWAKASSATYIPEFQIGVLTDPNNISTFVGVDTITITSGTTWTLVEVPLTAYTGTGKYVAVKADRAASYWYAYVDDFTLEYTPTCIAPRNIVSTAATASSITIDWTDLSQPSSWEIRYAQNGTTYTVSTTSHPYTVTGFDALTTYNFQIRAICGAGDTSVWSIATPLSTDMCDNATEVLVGDSSMTTTTSYYVPVNNFYNYTLTEFIIDSAELGDITEITAMSFYYSYSSPSTVKTDVDIYLMHTTDAVFASTEDLHVVDTSSTATNPAVLVYSGPLNCVQGWNIFGLNAPFAWDGHSNIMVVIDDNSGDYDGSAYIFTARNCNGNKTLNWYSDTYNPDPTNSTYSGSKYLRTYRPEMRLISCGISCPKPTALPATDVTYHSATVNWNSNATDFEVAVKAATDATWPAETAVSNATSFAVDNLAPATQYQFRVRTICDAAEGLISDWVEGTFVTDSLPCFVPTDLHTTAIGYTTATLAWTADASQNQWSIRVWTPANGTDFEVTSNPFTVTGLAAHTTYYAAIKAVCGGGYTESEYSDTIEFTTETCAQVTGVTVSQITVNSAVVTWNAVNAVKYEIEYGDRNFNQGTGTTIVVNEGTTYTLTGLLPDYDYSVFVRAYCEENVDGAWSDQVDFTTPQQGGGGEGINTPLHSTPYTLSIFPNPTTDATTIAISGVNGEVEITIVDMNGRTVASETMSCEGDCTKRMEVSSLAQGAYFVRINGDSINAVKKLIVK